jgi:hypothetical protein
MFLLPFDGITGKQTVNGDVFDAGDRRPPPGQPSVSGLRQYSSAPGAGSLQNYLNA